MNIEPAFNSGDVVRLRKDFKDVNLKIGDYGVIWAICEFVSEKSGENSDFDYEATFWNKEGNDVDLIFEREAAEKVLKIEDVPFSESMKEFWLYINQK